MATFDLFIGGRLEGLTSLTQSLYIDTTGGVYDSAYSDCAVTIAEQGSFRYSFWDESGNVGYTVPAGNYVMAHASIYYQQGNLSDILFAIYDQSGRRCVGMCGDGNGNYYLAHNTGTEASPVWVQVGTGTVYRPMNGGLGTADLQLVIDAGGNHTAMLVANNNLVSQGAVVDTGITGATGVYHAQLHNGSGSYSQLLARQNGNTIAAHVKTCRATGPGSHSDWTGAYTDVNEVATNDSTVNQATTAGLKQSYPMTNVAVPTGYQISGVFHWLRAKNGGASPENIKSMVVDGGTEYDAAANMTPSVGLPYGPIMERYDVSPATGVAWTQTEWNAPVELGFISEA